MIKEALEYLVSLKDTRILYVNNDAYSDRPLTRVPQHVDRPAYLTVGSLDAIVKLVQNEQHLFGKLFVQINEPTEVEVYTTLDAFMARDTLYLAKCKDANFREGWRDQQAAIIELKSRFIPTEGSEYLLDLISRIDNGNNVSSSDNGVSQTVTAKQGVALKAAETVRQRVELKPFRTFREVAQPESEFILRLDDAGRVGLLEADGGIWKMEAKDNIAAYLADALEGLVESGDVVIMA